MCILPPYISTHLERAWCSQRHGESIRFQKLKLQMALSYCVDTGKQTNFGTL